MSKVYLSTTTGHYNIFCPGCKVFHAVAIGRLTNGNLDKPTFAGSLGWTGPVTEGGSVQYCHSIVENGMIRFLDDSHHELKGKTVELPDIAEGLAVDKNQSI
jgi:hypothetical protein